jgi:hypothetical protein
VSLGTTTGSFAEDFSLCLCAFKQENVLDVQSPKHCSKAPTRANLPRCPVARQACVCSLMAIMQTMAQTASKWHRVLGLAVVPKRSGGVETGSPFRLDVLGGCGSS